MKKINQIIFIFLLFILSFSQSFGSEVWRCTGVDHKVTIDHEDKNSCLQDNMCLSGSCVEIEENTNSGNGGGGEGGDGGENGGSEGGVVDIDPIQGGSEGEESSGYKLLAPIGGLSFVSYDPDSTEFVGGYLNKIFLLSIGIISVLAVVMLIIAGIQYMGQDSIFGKSEAKNQMTNAILGLLIAVGSFAILNTISPNLIGTELKIRKLSVSLDESVHGDAPHSAMMDKETGELYFCNDKNYTKGKDWGKDSRYESAAITRAKLKENDIQVNKTECEKIGDENCTSVYGLKIDGVLNLKKKCPSCNVIITGGTECWLHSVNTNHRPGNDIVDLNIDGVKGYIEDARRSVREEIGEWGGETNVSVFSIDGVGRFVKELVRAHYHVVNWDGK